MNVLFVLNIFLKISMIFSGQMQFFGYTYSRPVINNNTRRNVDEKQNDLPAVAQADFIDDIITDQKQQILSSILSETGLLASTSQAEGNKHFVDNKCAACTCGVPNVNRIVGGIRVRSNKYPWIAQLLRGSFQYCGAALINDRYALTAAHCVYGMNINIISVRLLQLDKNSPSQGILRNVAYANIHSLYNPSVVQHDIALLRLVEPVPLVDYLRPVCLPRTPNQNFDFQEGIVAGWGLTSEGGQQSAYLRELVVPIITNAQCRATSYKTMILDTMLCAGYLEGGRDSCQGDSGGPLIVREGIFRLAGVVSYGYGCAARNAPGVYTRVSRYLNWIAANTRDACYCAH